MLFKWLSRTRENEYRTIRFNITSREKTVFMTCQADSFIGKLQMMIDDTQSVVSHEQYIHKRYHLNDIKNTRVKVACLSDHGDRSRTVSLEEDEIFAILADVIKDWAIIKDIPNGCYSIDEFNKYVNIKIGDSKYNIGFGQSQEQCFTNEFGLNMYFWFSVGGAISELLFEMEKRGILDSDIKYVDLTYILERISDGGKLIMDLIKNYYSAWMPIIRKILLKHSPGRIFGFCHGGITSEWWMDSTEEHQRLLEEMAVEPEGLAILIDEKEAYAKRMQDIDTLCQKRISLSLKELSRRKYLLELIWQTIETAIKQEVGEFKNNEKVFKPVSNRDEFSNEYKILALFGLVKEEDISNNVLVWNTNRELMISGILGSKIYKDRIDLENRLSINPERIYKKSFGITAQHIEFSSIGDSEQCRIAWRRKCNGRKRHFNWVKEGSDKKVMRVLSRKFLKQAKRCERCVWMVTNDMGSNPGHSHCLQQLHHVVDSYLIEQIEELATEMLYLHEKNCSLELESEMIICESALSSIVLARCCDDDFKNNINILIEAIASLIGIYDKLEEILQTSGARVIQTIQYDPRNEYGDIGLLGLYRENLDEGEIKYRAKLYIDEIGWSMCNRSGLICMFNELVLCKQPTQDENLIMFKRIGCNWHKKLTQLGEQIVDEYLSAVDEINFYCGKEIIRHVDRFAGGSNTNIPLNYYNCIRILFCASIYFSSSTICSMNSDEELPENALVII